MRIIEYSGIFAASSEDDVFRINGRVFFTDIYELITEIKNNFGFLDERFKEKSQVVLNTPVKIIAEFTDKKSFIENLAEYMI